MRCVILSDTHEKHSEVIVPEGDLLIHCGDFTNRGSDAVITNFLTWFSGHQHKYKCFIMGNHELGTDGGPNRPRKLEIVKSFTDKYENLFYLENSPITIEGINLYGSGYTPFYHNWAWNVMRGEAIAKCWARIPTNTNLLITHGPPRGILDLVDDYGEVRHEGCDDLLDKVWRLPELRLHCMGHLHNQSHQVEEINGITFVNAAIVDDRHRIIHQPVIIDI